MIVQHEEAQQDASAWSAVVVVAGVIYRASYVANKLSCSLGPYKHAPRRPRWALQSVQKWAEQRVAALSPEWMAMHREMYGQPA